MRRLTVISCPQSWDGMAPVGEGNAARRCEACELDVVDSAALDREGLEGLLDAAKRGRTCARFELEGGQPRLASGLAAGLVVIALAGCANSGPAPSEAPSVQSAADSGVEGAGQLVGVIQDLDGRPVKDAVVVLQSVALPEDLDTITGARGSYEFAELPPGEYTIRVLAGKTDVSKTVQLSDGARTRLDVEIDRTREFDMIVGMVVEIP